MFESLCVGLQHLIASFASEPSTSCCKTLSVLSGKTYEAQKLLFLLSKYIGLLRQYIYLHLSTSAYVPKWINLVFLLDTGSVSLDFFIVSCQVSTILQLCWFETGKFRGGTVVEVIYSAHDSEFNPSTAPLQKCMRDFAIWGIWMSTWQFSFPLDSIGSTNYVFNILSSTWTLNMNPSLAYTDATRTLTFSQCPTKKLPPSLHSPYSLLWRP
jgi:hypothetical protein